MSYEVAPPTVLVTPNPTPLLTEEDGQQTNSIVPRTLYVGLLFSTIRKLVFQILS